MLENLTANIKTALKTLRGQGQITDINIASTIKEIRRALIQADVDYKVARDLTDNIKVQALGTNILSDVSPRQLFIKIVYEQLTQLMGGTTVDIQFNGNPAVVLLVGLQGAGKTTLSVKLANYIKRKKAKDVLLVACDVYRPAAIEQLKILASSNALDVYAEEDNKDVLSIAQNAIKQAKLLNKQVVIVDTAGRLAINEAMMDEIVSLKEHLNPSETLFVVDAMIGQDAVNTAKTFNERVNFDGVVLTKLDGDARGGSALSIATIVKKPIKFIGTGEKVMDFEIFHPDRMANRILGMGDVVSLVEKAEQIYDEKQAKLLDRKITKNQLDFNDLVDQINTVRKIGSLKNIVSMIPGIGKMVGADSMNEEIFDKFLVLIHSMTPYERSNPIKLDKSRMNRIALGSGIGIQEANGLVKKFHIMKNTMQKMKTDKNFMKSIQAKMGV
jgi:signal recognition particle subunit SRP54